MSWLLLILSLPTENATVRMRAWRAIKALGAASLRDGVYLLPAHPDHLNKLVEPDAKGKIKTDGTRAKNTTGLWLVGFGGWTGYASATLIGVGRSARATVKEITEYLQD